MSKWVVCIHIGKTGFNEKGIYLKEFKRKVDDTGLVTWQSDGTFLYDNEMTAVVAEHYAHEVFDSKEEAETFRDGLVFGISLSFKILMDLVDTTKP